MAVRGKPGQLFTTAIATASSALAGRQTESQKMMQDLRSRTVVEALNLKDVVSYLRPKDFNSWSEGLRKAGLPE
jgi:hypothetical protein